MPNHSGEMESHPRLIQHLCFPPRRLKLSNATAEGKLNLEILRGNTTSVFTMMRISLSCARDVHQDAKKKKEFAFCIVFGEDAGSDPDEHASLRSASEPLEKVVQLYSFPRGPGV